MKDATQASQCNPATPVSCASSTSRHIIQSCGCFAVAGYAEGVKVATLCPHDNPATPACRHFGTCGGCSLQSMQYATQLHHKADHVAQLFTRVGKLNPDLVQATQQNPVVAAEPRRYQYRNKIQLAFSSRVWQAGVQEGLAPHDQDEGFVLPGPGRVVDGWGLGFYLPGSNSVVMPVEECSLVVSVLVCLSGSLSCVFIIRFVVGGFTISAINTAEHVLEAEKQGEVAE